MVQRDRRLCTALANDSARTLIRSNTGSSLYSSTPSDVPLYQRASRRAEYEHVEVDLAAEAHFQRDREARCLVRRLEEALLAAGVVDCVFHVLGVERAMRHLIAAP